jgi:hypothetical protein
MTARKLAEKTCGIIDYLAWSGTLFFQELSVMALV